MIKTIVDQFTEKIVLFKSFEHIFIFGSILKENKKPNDIDVLLLYSEYSNQLLTEFRYIKKEFSYFQEKPFSFIALSIKEEAETGFLKKLNPNPLKVK
ncbi:nucleotidyltransferase domain-containing protein [Leptospira mtsangambouensis]|uniref:Nucleotidyltransferase domain-containing protein n=1 Tax=Leptospira mtsangambouensis TaxID=2484912 RepID=A0ABY2NZ43_9LEPT|nr:nucleotidyltransferase domain-containing protein [Leptospira mtsangambouensis]TGM74292.1 nucleotidyltransferase domain-containing protein [Leptospira mtsangambouensis]